MYFLENAAPCVCDLLFMLNTSCWTGRSYFSPLSDEMFSPVNEFLSLFLQDSPGRRALKERLATPGKRDLLAIKVLNIYSVWVSSTPTVSIMFLSYNYINMSWIWILCPITNTNQTRYYIRSKRSKHHLPEQNANLKGDCSPGNGKGEASRI